ncbi:MAG: hypothetical protein ACI8XO_000358 [Verrucomicrobiales bacterium]|jgi:hypothetical protein
MIRSIILAVLLQAIAFAEDPHWAYELPQKGDRGIDALISSQLDADGLQMMRQEDPARLIRRTYLDLIGLPPSIAEVDSFVADPSDAHFGKIVDRLLASPRFGEKWATGWLDLARYADSDGYQRDGFRNVWPYRDWVIRAFNSDMPFDQFTIEQLAGDLLPDPTQDQLIATGFHRGPILNLEAGTDAEEDRVKQVIDRVNTTGTVWLATSFACAQCHDHKYDPISIEDYYSMYAFFNNTAQEGKRRAGGNNASMEYIGPDIEVPISAGEKLRLAEAEQKMVQAQQRFVAKVKELCDELPEEKIAKLKPKTIALLKKDVRDFKEAKSLKKTVFSKGEESKLLGKLEQMVNAHKKAAEQGSFQIGFGSRVMKEVEKPRETFVMTRGNFLTPGEKVAAATPAALHEFPQGAPNNRLGLAQWLVASDNPLTARVAVNRIWAELFGRGLVTTMEDFGSEGARPSHPQLLDFLAVKFREDDAWSMKNTIRRIVLSKTYRQSSAATADRRSQDPNNERYSRGPRNRLNAEQIRDNALSIAGLLSQRMFGPPVRPVQPAKVWRVIGEVDNRYYLSEGEDLYRRGVYTIWRRSAHYPSFANFDAPNRGACTVQRQSSNTPLQALTLMNDPAYVEMAQAFAERVQAEASEKELPDQLEHAFRLAVGRKPSAEELEALKKIYAGEKEDPWFDVATTLLNLHETITK